MKTIIHWKRVALLLLIDVVAGGGWGLLLAWLVQEQGAALLLAGLGGIVIGRLTVLIVKPFEYRY